MPVNSSKIIPNQNIVISHNLFMDSYITPEFLKIQQLKNKAKNGETPAKNGSNTVIST